MLTNLRKYKVNVSQRVIRRRKSAVKNRRKISTFDVDSLLKAWYLQIDVEISMFFLLAVKKYVEKALKSRLCPLGWHQQAKGNY